MMMMVVMGMTMTVVVMMPVGKAVMLHFDVNNDGDDYNDYKAVANEGATLWETGPRSRGHAEAGGGHSERCDVLLRLEQDDVDLGSKEAAQHDGATQTDGDAHGGGLDLQGTGTVGVSLETNLGVGLE